MWFNIYSRIIGFCGKIYPVMVLENRYEESKRICYRIEEVDKFIETNYKDKEVEEYHANQKCKLRPKYWEHWNRRFQIVKFLTECEQKKESFGKIFEEKKVPIFIAKRKMYYGDDKSEITLNPSLKEWEFVRMFDNYQTFQNIEMFMGNMAQPNKPIPEIDDLTMSEIKGFDKWSFRKEPKQKKS